LQQKEQVVDDKENEIKKPDELNPAEMDSVVGGVGGWNRVKNATDSAGTTASNVPPAK
jgi:hypothetical protein